MVEWRDVPWWDNYQVSTEGDVARKKDGVILKQYIQKSGYAAVYLKDRNGLVSAVMVHRIVAKAFLMDEMVGDKQMVDHINTIRHDNRLCNLRIVDAKGNANNELTKLKRRKRYAKQQHMEGGEAMQKQ